MKALDPEYLTACLQQNGQLTSQVVSAFRSAVYAHHRDNPRPMPWRVTDDPYRILVSEIMLQQTQVERVKLKYAQFLAAFPTVQSLADATLAEVLQIWQGLGYNRRAIALKRCAEAIMTDHGGQFPASIAVLEDLPGIGPYTARAVAAFAGGVAEAMIETNIRTVFIHFFFHDNPQVSDRQIMPLVAATLDHTNVREWYYALMDCGVLLKQRYPNPGRRSSAHTRQSRFEGSNRQQRSRLLKEIMRQPGITARQLQSVLTADQAVVQQNLATLQREGFLELTGRGYRIADTKKRG